MLTTIPFQGFYESIFEQGLDNVEEYLLDPLAEEYQTTPKIVAEALYYATDYRKAYIDVAKAYVDEFNDYLKSEHNLDLDLVFESLDSPKEYNFATDRIFCTISEENVRKLRSAVPDDELRIAIKSRFTSRSGFISSYPNDLDDWDPDVTAWDHNEIGTLLETLDHDDLAFDIYERLVDRNVFDQAQNNACDWKKFAEIVESEKEEA